MPPDRGPWCDAKVYFVRAYGRGYARKWDLPRVEWNCGSEQMSDDVKPVQSPECVTRVFQEVEGLKGEVQNIKQQRDDLLLLLDTEFKERNPVVIKPEWLIVAASLRKIAEKIDV